MLLRFPSVYRILSVVLSLVPVHLRFRLWQRLLKIGRQRYEREGSARRVPGGMYMKEGVRPSQGEVTHFVWSHTSIPVPVVVDNITHDGTTLLVLSRLPGVPLGDVLSEATPDQERKLSTQLSSLLAQLRAIPAPSQAVCGWNNTPIYCEHVALGARAVGPFVSVSAFHEHLMQRARKLNAPDDQIEEVERTIRTAHLRPHRVCLTHNDLVPHNILVDEQWNITGIIDWEASAWMPEYWELTKGTFLPCYRKGRWFKILTNVFPKYTVEQQARRGFGVIIVRRYMTL